MDQAIASIRRMAELEFDVLCPGHGAPLAGGADQKVRTMVRKLAREAGRGCCEGSSLQGLVFQIHLLFFRIQIDQIVGPF